MPATKPLWEQNQYLQKHKIIFQPLSQIMNNPLGLAWNPQWAQYLGFNFPLCFWNKTCQKHHRTILGF